MAEQAVCHSPLSALRPRQTVGDLVEEVAQRIAMVEHPRREARELVAALLDVPRHWPLLRANTRVEAGVWKRACDAADKRAAGAPLAYAVGRASFRQLTLEVDERVLIPRPETELLVDLVLERSNGGIVADVGTGSGAIAIALATEGEFQRVFATDISSDALAVAQTNAERSGAAIDCCVGDLLSALPSAGGSRSTVAGSLSVVVSNPPYIAFEELAALPASVRNWEPTVALTSGHSGLRTTARLVREAAAHLSPGGLLALEVDSRRASLVAEMIATDSRYVGVDVRLDLAGRERFVLATRRDNGQRRRQ